MLKGFFGLNAVTAEDSHTHQHKDRCKVNSCQPRKHKATLNGKDIYKRRRKNMYTVTHSHRPTLRPLHTTPLTQNLPYPAVFTTPFALSALPAPATFFPLKFANILVSVPVNAAELPYAFA